MKILYISTISDTMGFFTSHINMLLDQGHVVDMSCNVREPISKQLLDRGCRVHNIEFQRSPMKIDNYIAYRKLRRLITDEKYDIVHTHTPIASVCARLACRSLKKVKVIYTAHGFHFFNGAPLKNWLTYYPIELWLAHYTDVIIAINKEDYTRAKKYFKAGAVEYIPGVGLDIKKHGGVIVDRTQKRRELGLSEEAMVLLSVGELNKNKNHEAIMKAMVITNIPNICYVICGQGGLAKRLKDQANTLELFELVKLLGYRDDICEIYQVVDAFVLPSLREGLSVALMEAMAAGLPVICSDIRGNNDLIEDGKGGFLVASDNVERYASAIKRTMSDNDLQVRFGLFNKGKMELFSEEKVLERLRQIYENCVQHIEEDYDKSRNK